MRIAVWHNLPSGGGKRALFDHVRGLVRRGHHVEAWRPPTADANYLPLDSIVTEHVVPLEMPSKASALRLVSARHSVTAANIEAMDRHCRLCAEQMNAGKFDLLFANSCVFFRSAPIARYADMASVLYLQEPFRPLYEASPENPWLLPEEGRTGNGCLRNALNARRDARRTQDKRMRLSAEIRAARGFDAILVNSFFSRESVLRAYGLDSRVCYLGVDTDHFVCKGLPRQPIAVGIGYFGAAKNIEFIIDSVASVGPPRPQLIWIGNAADGGYIDSLHRRAAAGNVEFVAKVGIPDSEIVDILNRASFLVYAPRLEPFGYAPLEANACGLPVIAAAEGGIRETVVNGVNGFLVDPTRRAMADAIEHLVENPSQIERLGRQGRDLVEKQWALDPAIDRLEERFHEVVCSK